MNDTELYQEALTVWKTKNTWNLSQDDFIRLSYFHGCIEAGSNGKDNGNGDLDTPADTVYISPEGAALTRSMVTSWFIHSNAFISGYTCCYKQHQPKGIDSHE